MSAYTFFLVVGLVILIGFMGRLMKRRTLVPESLFLILFGLLLGPVLGIAPGNELLGYLPIVSVAAMVAILVESGIEFDISKLKGALKKATFFTFMVAILTTLLVTGFLHYLLGWDIEHAALLGLISSGTTTLTSMALLRSIEIKDNVRQLILLETIINDFTLILGTFLIVEIIKVSGFSLEHGIRMIMSEFSIAIILGVAATILWRLVLVELNQKKELSYISTLGMCFVLYFLADFLGGNPIISIFTFSLLFGNYRRIFKFIAEPDKKKGETFDSIIDSIRSVQTDMTFFLASSFFVLLGITFDVSILDNISPAILAGIVGVILIVRYFSATILALLDRTFAEYKAIIAIMIPRGYVAAVLAFVPAQEGIEIPLITDIIVILVIVTTLIAIIGTGMYAFLRKR